MEKLLQQLILLNKQVLSENQKMRQELNESLKIIQLILVQSNVVLQDDRDFSNMIGYYAEDARLSLVKRFEALREFEDELANKKFAAAASSLDEEEEDPFEDEDDDLDEDDEDDFDEDLEEDEDEDEDDDE